jgi:hypothetical protein
MAQKSRLLTLPSRRPLLHALETHPSVLLRTLPEVIVGTRGAFETRIVASESADGTWEAWLEFLPLATPRTVRHATLLETHQQTRTAIERWASGITRVYAEGALERATWRASRAGRRSAASGAR